MKPEVIILKHNDRISQMVSILSVALAEEGRALGCIFVGNTNGDLGILFNDRMSPDHALQILTDLEKVIPEAKEYWEGRKRL